MNFSCGQKAGHGTPGLIKNPDRTKFFMYLLSLLLNCKFCTRLYLEPDYFQMRKRSTACLQSDGALRPRVLAARTPSGL
jgi:hypothetical protein